jgi:DNA-binding winged helix-turn-helix (wHTH) protein/TolB-like protein
LASGEYKVGRFTLRPHRQLLDGGVPVSIGRKALDLLSVLAEADGALVTKDELMAAVWPNAIVEENAIQVHVAALRKVLGADAGLLNTEHGLGYRLEVTEAAPPQALSAEADAHAPPPQRSRPRALALFVLAVVIVAAAGYAWLRYAGTPARAQTPPTIAVLAFQPADSSEGAQQLANGLARSVASSLSRYDVTVVAASSSLQLTPAQRPQAGSLLGANFIVDGRIVSDHGKLTVSTQVSDTRKNILVYAFDVQGDGALGTQVADQIATRLALSLDPSKFLDDGARKFTATDYVLIARENAAIEAGSAGVDTTLAASRALAERYPEDGELQASAGIAIAELAGALPESQRSQSMLTARADIARGERLAPRSGLIYYGKADLAHGPMSLPVEERLLRQSMQVSPNFAPTAIGIGELMLQVGRIDEGVALVERSTQLDPLSDLVNGKAVLLYIQAGQEAQASQAFAREGAIWPTSGWIPYLSIQRAAYFGTVQDTDAVSQKYPAGPNASGTSSSDASLMRRAFLTRDKGLFRTAFSNCFKSYGQSDFQAWDDFCLFAMVQEGALDDAFRFAELAYPDTRYLYPVDDDRWLITPPKVLSTTRLFTPKMAAFRNDPRFWQVALRTGLVNYWLATQQWPDFCRGQLDICKARAAAVARSDTAHKT